MRNLMPNLFFYFLFTQVVFPQWESKDVQVQTNLHSVFFIDSLNGWIAGEDSTILHTSNGGRDWIEQTSGFSGYENNYNDVFFVNDTLGWVVGGMDYSGIILHTTDGGYSWSKQNEEITRRLNTIYFINDTVGWIGGGLEYPGGKIILKTTNGGLVWDTLLIETQPTNSIFDIKFINENIGWAVGGVYPGWGNIIMKTTDGGDNWITQLENYYYEPIASCDFISEQVGWATFAEVSYNPVGIINTTDGGTTWNMQYIPDSLSFESINSVIFINDYKGWAAGSRYLDSSESRILHTYDGGLNWELQNVPARAALNSIFFINEFTGWAVGDEGTVLHTTNGGVTFVEEERNSELPAEFFLSQNYPNPFNNSSVIRYSIPKSSQVTLKIFNSLGEEIETLVNGEKSVGTYEVNFNASSLPSGVYFYRIQAEGFISTKKMILLK